MTTTINAFLTTSETKIDKILACKGGLFVRIGAESAQISLEELTSELGVLIIDKADLPKVEQSGVLDVQFKIDGVEFQDTTAPKIHSEAALRHLALAEYLEAHPPVDEQQVEALTGALDQAFTDTQWTKNNAELARALIATGKVTVQS